ncbi:alkaline phosphatase family protein [Streptomyces sp. CA-135486]|uniref:alkaline phosphatase family protein n=1 Tax=Streptomyces sp. CA-135486 TaxID=3240049 RepID=UPI003D8E91CF
MRLLWTVLVGLIVVLVPVSAPAWAADGPTPRTPIRHFVYLMQGDRTFDHYFGTYPGANGIPAGVRMPRDPARPAAGSVAPHPLSGKPPVTLAAGHSVIAAQYNKGAMNGFVAAYERQGRDGAAAMGYYDRRDLPVHWNAADRYVLFDRFFASSQDGIRTNRAFWVAGRPDAGAPTIFDRLNVAGVSWKFYVQDHEAGRKTVRVPLAADDPHVVDLDEYYCDLERGTLPAVAYIASSGASERSARSVPAGQQLVRSLATQLMLSRYWGSSALLWSYDGSGGWYDHVKPPAGNGFRVPAVLVSPYVARGKVDHTALDAASALRFVEENWRLRTLGGRVASANSLGSAFDFASPPRTAELIPDGSTTAPPPARPVDSALVYGVYGGAVGVAAVALGAAGRWRRRDGAA